METGQRVTYNGTDYAVVGVPAGTEGTVLRETKPEKGVKVYLVAFPGWDGINETLEQEVLVTALDPV